MRVVFLGSGAFAIPSFEALLEGGHEVAALVTQPDREKGRGRELAPPPLKPVATARGIPVLQPQKVRHRETQDALRSLRPDIQVVVAYGQILPRSVIDIAPRGTVNVHASLLPRYRGAAPIQWAIARGERETGVTTMLIDEGMDTGPILKSARTTIGDDETAPELEPRLARLGAALLLETLLGLVDGSLVPVPQDPAQATYAPILKKEDGVIDWTLPASAIAGRVRGFQPWPGSTTSFEGRPLKLLRVRPEPPVPAEPGMAAPEKDAPGTTRPGTVIAIDRDSIVVACGEGTRLPLLVVQPESRRAMSGAAFAAGARLRPGARLG
jgi:methionyl-tRNA formyltransferase